MTALDQLRKEELYKIYLTDALFIAVNNIGRIAGGKELTKRYIDLITPTEKEIETTQEEVIDHIKERLRALG